MGWREAWNRAEYSLSERGSFMDVSAEDRIALARELLAGTGRVDVPVRPTVAMLQDGYDAMRNARHPGVSGQTTEAVVRATAYRELAAYDAMVKAAMMGDEG